MALSKSTLASAIETDLLTLYESAESSPMSKETFASEMSSVIANNVIDHITSNAEVSTNVSVAQVTAVTSGSQVSGPGSGSGTGTVA